MNIDDPKLTAFALGELGEIERSTIAGAVADSPEAQRFVDETRSLAEALKNEYAASVEKKASAPAHASATLIDIRDDPWFWSVARPLAVAAVLALLGIIAGIVIFSGRNEGPGETQVVSEFAEIQGEIDAADLPAAAGRSGENPFLDPKNHRLSTFPIEVDTSSYSDVRRSIDEGLLPSRDAVRIEEMINYFTYDYAQPEDGKTFALYVDLTSCPWEPSHRLVRIGLKGRDIGIKSGIIAKDARIDVEFNPECVASYRLIGYEMRKPKAEDQVEARKIRTGYMVTALYEIVPIDAKQRSTFSGEMLAVNLFYKKPDNNKSEFVRRAVTDDGADFANASPDLKFAAAVAEFGMLLRNSEYKGNGTFGAVLEWAHEGKGDDANGYRAGFIELVRRAQMLKRG